MNTEKGSIWILGGGVVLLVALSIAGPLFFEGWFAGKGTEEKKGASLALLAPPKDREGPRPWIEITNENVSLLTREKGKKIRSLASGDELNAGMSIAADQTGKAIIHFQDGSIARIDRDTELTLEAEAYDASDKTLTVALKLVSGRIWSRIVELATPASLWEVKTINAVAVVRGTAFGVEYSNDISRVIGSEDEVTVIPIDPKTNERLKKAAVVITPDTYVEITKKGVSPIRKTPREIKEADWIQEAGIQQKEKENQRAKQKTMEVKPTAAPNRFPRVTTEKLTIQMDLKTKTIREGEKKTLRAVALMSDDTKRDVSDRVTWKVIGAIGSIAPDGTFTPKLIGIQAEFGSAIGSIVATLTTENGQELIGTTPTFEVQATVEEELDLRG